MIRRPPRSTLSSSSAASDVYKRQVLESASISERCKTTDVHIIITTHYPPLCPYQHTTSSAIPPITLLNNCLLYTSDAADEEDSVDLGGRRIIKKKKKIEDNCRCRI
eukprot:TRINITY_DN6186_c0_g1_i13.p1 TRINITY_DN6186_c0_g1~~TRINITY_DN6186_c0_g1_i13.p1  ORF type:complete len:107 (+),score=19.66 TRINITY_DN6186_c0_g1_i13:127-447(+)